MTSESLLAIDSFQADSIRQTVPEAPLLSTNRTEWNGIHLAYHNHSANETPQHIHLQHVMVLHPAQPNIIVERQFDEGLHQELFPEQKVALIPAGVPHYCNWKQHSEFLLLSVNPLEVAKMAYEWVNPDRVELVPHFSQPDPLIYQLGITLKAELESDRSYSRLYGESVLALLSVHLLRHYTTRPIQLPPDMGGLSRSKLQQALEYIQAHLAGNPSLMEISQEVEMSHYYFGRLFKESMGISPHQYLIQQRVERAKQLLSYTTLPIAEIAHECGFSDQSSLTRQFRRLIGVTPKVYRAQSR
jgi:AraC family transcriptional regulator